METPGKDINVGGTSGGFGLFIAGAALAAISAWFFVDAVSVVSRPGYGAISRGFGSSRGSAGVVFLPLFVSVVWLFMGAKKPWPWVLFGVGVAVILVEILSSLTFWFDAKLSHFLIMLFGFAAGLGMLIRSLRSMPPEFLES